MDNKKLYDIIVWGEGYNATVEEYIDGCLNQEEAKKEAIAMLEDGFIYFPSLNAWEQASLDEVKNMENFVNELNSHGEFGFATNDFLVAIKNPFDYVIDTRGNENYYETLGYFVAICPKDADIKEWVSEFFTVSDER